MQQHNINNTNNSNTAMELNQELSSINSIYTWGFFTTLCSALYCSLLNARMILGMIMNTMYKEGAYIHFPSWK
jgi:hypothetical protein